MKLDDTAKVVAICSTLVTAVIGVAGYVSGRRLQALETRLTELTTASKRMDVQKQQYDASARLIADFSVPLARSFALQAEDLLAGRKVLMPDESLGREFAAMVGGWEARRGLMTGSACRSEGLKARQVVTLVVSNIGTTDATDVRLTVRRKGAPGSDPSVPWPADGAGARIGYDNLLAASSGWTRAELPLDNLRGQGSPEASRSALQIVLASVSGTSSLYGTVLVPMELSWTDRVSQERQVLPIYPAHVGELRASLLGAEIGSLGAACR